LSLNGARHSDCSLPHGRPGPASPAPFVHRETVIGEKSSLSGRGFAAGSVAS